MADKINKDNMDLDSMFDDDIFGDEEEMEDGDELSEFSDMDDLLGEDDDEELESEDKQASSNSGDKDIDLETGDIDFDDEFAGFGDDGDLDNLGSTDNKDNLGIDSDTFGLDDFSNDKIGAELEDITPSDEQKKVKKSFYDLTPEEIANLSIDEANALLENEDISDDGIGLGDIGELTPGDSLDSSIGADHDGSILDENALLTDGFETINKDADFISETGEIVVMDTSESGDNFKFQYIDIENIAVVKRIRKNTTNVEDLVQSIKSTGLLEPLVVAPTATEGTYVLLAGFRRLMACAKAGKRKIPCIVNIKANVPEIPVLEALYNHSKSYTIKEIVDYIDYLEKQKGIMSASMIEYLLQLNSGDYTKLKDILNDNDDDIVSKLYDGILTIEAAFKKLEQRRKKESAEEKDNKKAAKVYEDENESGAANIAGSGDEASDEGLTEDEIKSLAFNAADLEEVDSEDFNELKDEGDNIEGFKPHKQDYKERERLDPTLRKSVLARDKNTCKICEIISGQEFTEVLDVHHIVEVYLGGDDSIDNLITACTVCHKLIHLYGRGELHIRPEEELTEQEKNRFKRIMRLGTVIRKGLAAKGMKRDELKKVDGANTIGRTKPGTGQVAG